MLRIIVETFARLNKFHTRRYLLPSYLLCIVFQTTAVRNRRENRVKRLCRRRLSVRDTRHHSYVLPLSSRCSIIFFNKNTPNFSTLITTYPRYIKLKRLSYHVHRTNPVHSSQTRMLNCPLYNNGQLLFLVDLVHLPTTFVYKFYTKQIHCHCWINLNENFSRNTQVPKNEPWCTPWAQQHWRLPFHENVLDRQSAAAAVQRTPKTLRPITSNGAAAATISSTLRNSPNNSTPRRNPNRLNVLPLKSWNTPITKTISRQFNAKILTTTPTTYLSNKTPVYSKKCIITTAI